MSVEQKNFVVGFRNDSSNINSIIEGGYGKDIMNIMATINSCRNFDDANNKKIPYIQDYIYRNMEHIDFLIYLYGHSLVIKEYIDRFGAISAHSQVLEADFATIIIGNIIVIYEALRFPENITTSVVDSSNQDVVVKEEGNDENEEELLSSSLLVSTDYLL